MRYVIIRDDDTNAFTPVECLERLYRPFLGRGLPVNLATIPDVATSAETPDGRSEGFLAFKNGTKAISKPIGSNRELVNYLQDNPLFQIVQHGFHHDWLEFETLPAGEIGKRLERGTQLLLDAGFSRPQTFVAPYDKFSRDSLFQVAKRFRVISTGWFELGRLPVAWWPKYAVKKVSAAAHWQIGRTVLLSHPGCLLSCLRPSSGIMTSIVDELQKRRLTVLVTHWWEYFRDGKPDDEFIGHLHETAEYLERQKDLKVISFSDLLTEKVPLN